MILVYDLETTGLNPQEDEILSIGLLPYYGEDIQIEGINLLLKPQKITEQPIASKINGIYPETVANCPTINEIRPLLHDLFMVHSDLIVGFNQTNFDN